MDKKTLLKAIFGVLFIGAFLAMAYFSTISNTLLELQKLGISENIIYLTLIIPIITFFVSLSRIVIGLHVGNFINAIFFTLTSFVIGIETTALILLIGFGISFASKYLMHEFHFHFVSKSAFIISFVTIGIYFLLPFLISRSIFSIANGELLTIYSILIIAVLLEKYTTYKITANSSKEDFSNLIKTLVFAGVIYIFLGGNIPFINYQFLFVKSIILQYPETIFVALILNIFVGLYTGLRLNEIIKFRKIIFKR